MKHIRVLLLIFTIIFSSLSSVQGNQFPLKNILLIINYSYSHYESIPLLREVYEPYFPNIVFYGPSYHPDVHVSAFSYEGYYSYVCIAEAMQRYSNFDGYFFVHDDCIINAWHFNHLDQNKIWFPKISFLHSDSGNPGDLKKGLNAFSTWKRWKQSWGYEAMKKSFELLPQKYRETLMQNWGDSCVVAAYSDILYIPAQYKNDFISLALLFGIHKVFLETALPTIVSCFCSKKHWEWMLGHGVDRSNPRSSFRLNVCFNHPLKLSGEKNRKFLQMLNQEANKRFSEN